MDKFKSVMFEIFRIALILILWPALLLWIFVSPLFSYCESKWAEAFSDIWGWNVLRCNPEDGIRDLKRYVKAQQRRPPEKRHPYNPELQFLLGVAYLSDWIPCKNPAKKAETWFRRSADQDYPPALMAIGYLNEKGLSNCSDETIMLNYYLKAAEAGNAAAQYRLASFLHNMPNGDPVEIKELLTDAASQEYKPARFLLAELYPETVHNSKYREIYGDDWEEISRRQKEQRIGLYNPYQKDEQPTWLKQMLIYISECIQRMQAEFQRTQHAAETAADTALRIEVAVMMQQATLEEMWTEIRSNNSKIAQNLSDLQQRALEKAGAEKKKQAEEFLAILFGDDWRTPGRLCKESCDALVDAHVLMSVAEENEISNYAGIVITALWALEHETRRRFYFDFFCYLQANEISIPRCMHLGGKPENKLGFTLGSISDIVHCPEFEEFAQRILLSEAAKNIQQDKRYRYAGWVFSRYNLPGIEMTFTNLVNILRDEYRNEAAHGNLLTREQAIECCDLLGITNVHSDLNKIEGALKALLWLTAPVK